MGSRKQSAPAPAPEELVVASTPDVPVVLRYLDGPVYGDAPARDLTAADLAYIHRVGALRASGGDPVKPATAADIATLAERLEATGSFARNDPAAAEGPAAPADPAEEN